MLRRWILTAAVLLVAGTGGAGGYVWYHYFRPPVPEPRPPSFHYRCNLRVSGVSVTVPHLYLVAEIARYRDEVFSYMMYDYLRGQPLLRHYELLLTVSNKQKSTGYTFLVHMPPDLLTSLPALEEMLRSRMAQEVRWRWVPQRVLDEDRMQTRVFRAAYGYPAQHKLEQMSPQELAQFTRRFIRLKAITDRRIRLGLAPLPDVPSPEQARQLAHDIITVATFYDIPLDMFLGIGAMENNYMDVRGDTDHAIWKRRAEPGDIVLRRTRGRVLVLNYATGVWQITRETLRLAHRLYLKDKRDYSKLPERLRPPRKLDLNDVSTGILTTYAGLLFRYLLDHFKGDVAKAVGAYNGGPGNPNMHYEKGVREAAEYARRLLEQMSAVNEGEVTDYIRRHGS